MSTIQTFLKELDHEAATTRKMLERIPDDRYSWKPHEKSMTIKRLATHIAELPGWATMVLSTDELDFADSPYQPEDIHNTKELLACLERSVASGKSSLETAKEEDLNKEWILREGEQVYSRSSKAEVIRMALNQIVHHRAQMGVYLRLLDIPIPASYGPSADETGF